MKPHRKKKLSGCVRILLIVLAIFVAYYFYSSYLLAHNSEIIVICTVGVVLCMGLRCANIVSQNKREGVSMNMDDDI